MRPLVVRSTSAAQTRSWGKRLSRLLKKGDVILLIGELGAGKTTFVQGLAAGLGLKEGLMSPTFTLAQSFNARVPLHHLDFYRLTPKEILNIGIGDYLTGGGEIPAGAALIEWADRCKNIWPKERFQIHFTLASRSTERRICFHAYGRSYEERLQKIKK